MKRAQNPTQYAVNLLSKREYSPKELETKLTKAFPEAPDKVQKTITMLLKENYLSEERFAAAYARHIALTTTKGPYAIKQALQKKGVSAAVAEKAIETEIQTDMVTQTLQKLITKKHTELEKKYTKKMNEATEKEKPTLEWQKKQKLIQFLMRKGYSLEDINKNLP